MEERKIEFWDQEDVEYLSHTEQDEAIEYILDVVDELTGTLEICGYARMGLPKAERLADDILENVLEDLDCNYELGSPDDGTEPTDDMKEAALVFAKALLKDYTPWACEIVKKETIDIASWVKENRPDWLEKPTDI